MNPRYGWLVGGLGAGQLALAAFSGWWAPLLVWSGISFLGVGLAYLRLGPGIFGKGVKGRLCPWRTTFFLPYLLLTWAVWELQRRSSREPLCHEIIPGLWLGRRPLPAEIPECCRLVVDLTCEFPESAAAIGDRRYLVLPTLDAGTPDPKAFKKLAREIAAGEEPVYIHCALGRGRSAMFVAAVLLARGVANSVEEAEARIRTVRPSIKLAPNQREFLHSHLGAGSDPASSESPL